MKNLLYLCAALLVLAVFPLPSGFYTVLRIVVTIGAFLIAKEEYKNGINTWVIVFGLMTIVFNPLIPVYLHNRELWAPIDIIGAILFVVKARKTK